MNGPLKRVEPAPVAFVQLANGTVYAARPAPKPRPPARPARDAVYDRASAAWDAHLRAVGHEDG